MSDNASRLFQSLVSAFTADADEAPRLLRALIRTAVDTLGTDVVQSYLGADLDPAAVVAVYLSPELGFDAAWRDQVTLPFVAHLEQTADAVRARCGDDVGVCFVHDGGSTVAVEVGFDRMYRMQDVYRHFDSIDEARAGPYQRYAHLTLRACE